MGDRFIDYTPPSMYDLDVAWCLTIGKAEYEDLARTITRYCQDHGDRWQPVPNAYINRRTFLLLLDPAGFSHMREGWLALLQRVRVKLEGPAELIRNDRALYGLQLRYPNGRIEAAAFHYSPEALQQWVKERPFSGTPDGTEILTMTEWRENKGEAGCPQRDSNPQTLPRASPRDYTENSLFISTYRRRVAGDCA